MNKHRHLPHLVMLVGFLAMTASAVARQSNIAGSPFNTPASPSNTTDSPFKSPASPSSPAATRIETTKPGEQVERQLSGDQKFREWSLDANAAANVAANVPDNV